MIARHWLPASLRSDLAHRLVGATIGSAGIWAAGTLATLAIGVLLARPLGPEGYGVYGTALAIVSLLGVPATFGLPLLATRELAAAQARGDVAALAGHRRWFPRLVLVSAAVTAAALLGGLAVLGHLIAPHVRMTLVTGALLVPGLALCALGSAMLRGLGEVVAGQALDVLARPLLFLAGLVAVHGFATGFTPEGAVAVQAVTSAVVAIGGFWWLSRQWSADVRTTPPASELRRWGASAWPLALADGFRVLEGAYGVLLVSALSTTFEAGLLRVALASLALCTAPISLQNLIVAPYLSEAYAQQRMGQVQRIAAGSALFMTMAVGAATLGFALVGPWLLPFVFGDAFAPAYPTLLLLCLGQLVTGAAGPGVTLLAMMHAEKEAARAFAVPTVLGACAVALLAPVTGATGAAAAILASSLLRVAMVRYAVWRHGGIRISVLAFRPARS
jgi:O-antigen/teichoic acid export membrane protein